MNDSQEFYTHSRAPRAVIPEGGQSVKHSRCWAGKDSSRDGDVSWYSGVYARALSHSPRHSTSALRLDCFPSSWKPVSVINSAREVYIEDDCHRSMLYSGPSASLTYPQTPHACSRPLPSSHLLSELLPPDIFSRLIYEDDWSLFSMYEGVRRDVMV